MNKHSLMATLASGVLATTLAGCGSKPVTSAPQHVTISLLTLWPPPLVSQFDKAVTRYEKLHPQVTVQVQAVPFGELLSTITTDALSPNAPTIYNIYDLWLPQLAQDHVVAPAPSSYAQDVRAYWAPSLAKAVQVGGKIYGYPNEVDDYALDYNKALFQQAHISHPPHNWVQLQADAKKLTKVNSAGQMVQQGFSVITGWNSGVVHPWMSLMQSDGGQLLDSKTHMPNLTSSAARQTLNLYHSLIFEDKATNPALDSANASTTGPYLNNFAAGRTGMIIMANWWESDLQSAMGNEFHNVGVAPIPVGPHGTVPRSVYYAWLFTVNGHATNAQQRAAWQFLRWINSPASGQGGSSFMGRMLTEAGDMPSRTGDIRANARLLDTPFMTPYVQELSHAMPFPLVLGGAQLTTDLQKQIEAMEYGTQTIAQTMSRAQQQATSLLKQYYH